MKDRVLILFLVIFMTGFIASPVFVFAKNTCYVDEDAKESGDGSKDEPYKKISKALDKGCKEVVVQKGKYKDSIILGKGITLKGKSRDGVVITGNVTMKDGSKLDKVTVSGNGVEIDKNADAKITNSKIKDAHIGIETLGNGTLTVEDTSFSGNHKALYLQRGKNVKITGCKVYNNSEEGIDIRSNVDGVISGNEIYSNGESGIEVILGKSDLTIKNNSIKNNKASGIAAQYYTHASKIGAVKVIGNTITGNKDYGINCKNPSGGTPPANYWSSSLKMTGNKISNNKDGNFAAFCFFDDNVTVGATKTKEQIEEKQRQAEEIKKQKRLEGQKKKEEEEQKRLEGQKKKQELIAKDVQNTINSASTLEDVVKAQEKKLQTRPEALAKLIGPDYKVLGEMSMEVEKYKTQIEEAQQKSQKLTDEQKKQQLQNQIQQMEQTQSNLEQKIQEYNDEFSVYKWILETIQW